LLLSTLRSDCGVRVFGVAALKGGLGLCLGGGVAAWLTCFGLWNISPSMVEGRSTVLSGTCVCGSSSLQACRLPLHSHCLQHDIYLPSQPTCVLPSTFYSLRGVGEDVRTGRTAGKLFGLSRRRGLQTGARRGAVSGAKTWAADEPAPAARRRLLYCAAAERRSINNLALSVTLTFLPPTWALRHSYRWRHRAAPRRITGVQSLRSWRVAASRAVSYACSCGRFWRALSFRLTKRLPHLRPKQSLFSSGCRAGGRLRLWTRGIPRPSAALRFSSPSHETGMISSSRSVPHAFLQNGLNMNSRM